MSKRPHQHDGPPRPTRRNAAWSVGSNGLTSDGQAELLKQLGRQLQNNYQGVLKEPAPDRIKSLLEKLDARRQEDSEEGL